MKKLIILVVGFIILAGGTVGVLKYMSIGPFDSGAPELTEEEIKAQEALAEAKAILEARPFYVEMDPIQVPMFQGDGVSGTIMINYKLESRSIDNQQTIAKAKRQIGNALMQDFAYYIPRTLRNNKNLDVTLVKHRIVMISTRVVGKGIVTDALIQAMTSTDQ